MVREFQSTPPRGGRPSSSVWILLISRFNPRPRAGGDRSVCFVATSARVSIHAPARGATKPCGERILIYDVSIHAPARGATSTPTPRTAPNQCFNPRPRAGGDLLGVHEPAWYACFNPRPRAGGDPSPPYMVR